MTITVELPDDLARRIAADGQDLSRAALEALALEAFCSRRLSEHQLSALLGLSRHELDGFLKLHGVWPDYTAADFDREQEAGDRLWRLRQKQLELSTL